MALIGVSKVYTRGLVPLDTVPFSYPLDDALTVTLAGSSDETTWAAGGLENSGASGLGSQPANQFAFHISIKTVRMGL